MKRIIKISAVLVLAVVTFSCASTKIIGSWKDGDIGEKQYGSIMIVALTPNAVAKANVESQMATVLAGKGVNAKGAGGVFNPEVEITDEMKDQIAKQLESEGYDGLLTFALVAEEEKTSYTPGSYSYAPYSYGYGGSYWGYYGYYSPQVYQPGYYTTSEVYTVEAVLYDLSSEKMVWAARSESTDPSSLDKFSKEFSSVVAYQMMKDKMLKSK